MRDDGPSATLNKAPRFAITPNASIDIAKWLARNTLYHSLEARSHAKEVKPKHKHTKASTRRQESDMSPHKSCWRPRRRLPLLVMDMGFV